VNEKIFLHVESPSLISASQLAEDLSRDATPDFRVELVRAMFRRDPTLRAEVLAVMSDPGDTTG
jgi:hypothetical protein